MQVAGEVGELYRHCTTGQVAVLRKVEPNWLRLQSEGQRPFRLLRRDFEQDWERFWSPERTTSMSCKGLFQELLACIELNDRHACPTDRMFYARQAALKIVQGGGRCPACGRNYSSSGPRYTTEAERTAARVAKTLRVRAARTASDQQQVLPRLPETFGSREAARACSEAGRGWGRYAAVLSRLERAGDIEREELNHSGGRPLRRWRKTKSS